ncbi:MAG TPA: hypothetical protein VLE53_17915 [Gemmatimonadaceae bacterium]|nr:hypothetical protein [Gemmatimonadaceae bacterium]
MNTSRLPLALLLTAWTFMATGSTPAVADAQDPAVRGYLADSSLSFLVPLIGAWRPLSVPDSLKRLDPPIVAHAYRWIVGRRAIQLLESFRSGQPDSALLSGMIYWNPATERVEFVAVAGRDVGEGRLFIGEYRTLADGSIERTYDVFYRTLADTPAEQVGGSRRRYREVYRLVTSDSIESTLDWFHDGAWRPYGPFARGAFRRIPSQTGPAFEVLTAGGTGLEIRGQNQLERILRAWNLERWLFTRTARIQSRVIPHSHPVLTLNTQYIDNDTAQVATFIHEQLHWFLNSKPAARDSALADLRRLYPRAPAGPAEGGARDAYSTYLHLLVCMLEFESVRALFDEDTARRVLGGWQHYGWIYREVLERPEPIRRVLRARGLDTPDAREPPGQPR